MSEGGGRKLVPMPIKVGVGLTIILLVMVVYLASIYRCSLLESGALECRTNLRWFLDAPPNEIGDTIAGVFATLAFVWIVVTVFLQSAELAEQRKELELTRIELQLAREAQEAQLKVMQKQADIFEDEKAYRESESAKRVLDQLLSSVVIRAGIEKELNRAGNFSLKPRHELDLEIASPLAKVKTGDDDFVVRSFLDSLHSFYSRILDLRGDIDASVVTKKSNHRGFYSDILTDLSAILELRQRLSEDQNVRLRTMRVDASHATLAFILKADAIWGENI